MPYTDADLIHRVNHYDDRNAFGELVKRHQSAIRGMLRKLSNGDEFLADDLAQDTFLKAYKAIGRFRGHSKFSTWLYRIAYNVFVSEIRRKREYTSFDENPIDGIELPATDTFSLKHDLALAMKKLNEQERACIHLCYQEGLSRHEAAQVLDCPVGTVKTHILRGKEKLKKQMTAWRP